MESAAKGQENRQEREQTTIRLPLELKEQLQRQADQEGTALYKF